VVLVVVIADAEFEFALLGSKDHRLAFHPAHHVERRPGLSPQRHLKEVLLDAGLQGPAQLRLDLKVAIRRTECPDSLVGALVVVILDPQLNPFPGRFEAFKLRPDQELLPDRRPEPLHLSQGHRMLGTGFDVDHTILLHLRLKPAHTAPGRVLTPVVGEHFLRRLILPGRHPVYLDGCRCCRAPEQVRPDHIPGVVIHERDQVGIPSPQPEGEDIGLPELVGCCPLKEPGTGHVPAAVAAAATLHQLSLVQVFSDRFRAGLQQEHPPQNLRNPFDPPPGVLPLQIQDLLHHRGRQLAGPAAATPRRRRAPQPLFSLLAVHPQPPRKGAGTHPHLPAHQVMTISFLKA
jgi:hypothetical protein